MENMAKWTKESPEWAFWSQFYKFCEKYYEPKNTQEYWTGFTRESQVLYDAMRKNKKTEKFARKMIEAYSDFVTEVLKNG